jgi:Family of unknown function (DUF6615)
MKPTLRETLEELAVDVWEHLRDAQSLDVRFGEETITDLLLLDLKRQSSAHIRVFQTRKHLEALQGTDWEWWIGSDRVGWLRYAVQAKRLQINSGQYRSLGHRIGHARHALQIDALNKYAAANFAIPIYCFYNFVSGRAAVRAWQCCQQLVEEQQLGCTITPSHIVQRALAKYGGKNLRWIHSHRQSIPWRCLVGCPRVQQLYQSSRIPELMAAGRSVTAEFLGLPARIYPV